MAKRAYGREEKQERREEILATAHRLFTSGEGDLPSAADLAAGAGIAKGTLYLYYATREEIFASLLRSGWANLLDRDVLGSV